MEWVSGYNLPRSPLSFLLYHCLKWPRKEKELHIVLTLLHIFIAITLRSSLVLLNCLPTITTSILMAGSTSALVITNGLPATRLALCSVTTNDSKSAGEARWGEREWNGGGQRQGWGGQTGSRKGIGLAAVIPLLHGLHAMETRGDLLDNTLVGCSTSFFGMPAWAGET